MAADEVFGEGSAGAAFNVYAPDKYLKDSVENESIREAVKTWAFAVKAGSKLSYQWPVARFENRRYHLQVYGPNGFFRELKGADVGPAVSMQCLYARKKGTKALTGNIDLQLTASGGDIEVELKDWSYGNEVIREKIKNNEMTIVTLNTSKSYGWYDFSLFIQGQPAFERRYAGRVETGADSKSDPFMGRVVE